MLSFGRALGAHFPCLSAQWKAKAELDISVVGAGGAIGRGIVALLVADRVLKPTERLQIIGRGGGASERALYGLRSDLTDAYVETAPQIDIGLGPHDLVGDVVIMTAGVTPSARPGGEMSRDDVALANLAVFEAYARALARHGQGQEVVVVVTNPVELGVAVFAEHIGARRVIGIGAYSDSLRFRREIASDLGVPRQLVSGYVGGEHGEHLVPLWSSVRVFGLEPEEVRGVLTRLRPSGLGSFRAQVEDARDSIKHLLTGDTQAAYEAVEAMPADVRVRLRPELTHLSGSKTVMATANVTVDMVRQIVEGREMSVAGQVALDDTHAAYGLQGVLGLPLIVSNQGVVRVQSPPLWADEEDALRRAAESIRAKINHWRALS